VIIPFLIEKCYFEVLESALELYDAGELKSMRTYLEELDRNYADIDCEVASDGRSAIVAFEGASSYTKRLYLVGELDRMIYSNHITDYYISDDTGYTLVLYDPVFYGGSWNPSYAYTIFNNDTGEEVFSDWVIPNLLPGNASSDDLTAPQLRHEVEIVDENHFLVIDHDGYTEVIGEEYDGYYYSLLKLVDMNTGESVVLLEPDRDWLEPRDNSIDDGVKLSYAGTVTAPHHRLLSRQLCKPTCSASAKRSLSVAIVRRSKTAPGGVGQVHA